MHIAQGRVDETYINGWRAARIDCPSALIPAPGQYLLAQALNQANAPIPAPVYLAASSPKGFYAANPYPVAWHPGTTLALKGPLGHGFSMPPAARKVLLASWSQSPGRVLALLEACRRQKAEIVWISATPLEQIPLSVEILPPAALPQAAQWADYAALDIPHSQLGQTFTNPLWLDAQPFLAGYAQIFLETPVSCGGIAECGVCAVRAQQGLRLACKDGPVFNLSEIVNVPR